MKRSRNIRERAATLKIDDDQRHKTSRDFANTIGGATTANQIIGLTSLGSKQGTTTATLLNGTLSVSNGSTASRMDTVAST